jgi:CheY-like chemotaxis protein
MPEETLPHVLVVEDDVTNARLFEVMLERRGGFKVTTTQDVALLFDLATSRSIDLVLMDVSLPNSRHEGREIDGLQLTRKLKEDPRTADIPVVLATAHAMRGDRERFLAASKADDYVSKPIVDQAGLIARLKDILERKARGGAESVG